MKSEAVDLVFRAPFDQVNLQCLAKILSENAAPLFNYPEGATAISFEEIVSVFRISDCDLVFQDGNLNAGNRLIEHVFINPAKTGNDFEILFFFDLKDLKIESRKDALDCLQEFSRSFASEFNFNTFICRVDGDDDEDYYFDNGGYGPFYFKTIEES